MSVIAIFSIPATDLEFGDILDIHPGLEVRIQTVVPARRKVFPYLRVPTSDADAVERALADSPFASDVRVVDQVGEETLLRVEWLPEVDGFVDAIRETDGVITDATGAGDEWTFQVRFPAHEQLATFYQTCSEMDIHPTIERIYTPEDADSTGQLELTDEQRAALSLALETGYFDIPRQISAVEIGDRLGISDTAVSQRLRRGLKNVLTAVLSEPDGDR